MMLAVAIVAVALEVKPSFERWMVCRWGGNWHRSIAISARKAIADGYELGTCRPGPPVPLTADRRVVLNRRAEAHERLATKYERAAWYPWLLIAPDPPESD